MTFTQRAYYVLGLIAAYVSRSASSAVVPLNNYASRDCLSQLVAPAINSTNTHQANILVGWTGCPYYEAMLPVFTAACATLGDQHNCYMFNSSVENPPPTPTDYGLSPLVIDATKECVGLMPAESPNLVIRFAFEGSLPNGQITQAISNPAVAQPVEDNSTALELANYMSLIWNEFVGNPTRRLHNHAHDKREMSGQMRP